MSYVNSAAATAIVSLAATLMLAGTVITDAQAGDGGRQKAHSKQGAGGSRTQVSTVQRTGSGHTRNTTVTRNDGKTATRNITVVNDRAAGTRSVDSTTTGFNGRTTTYSSDAQRTNDGYVRDVTRTLPDGQVNQRNIDVSCDPASRSCTKTVNRQDGG
jgi:hypothetical protein